MREIKFRGISINLNRFVYSITIAKGTIGQYTGLKDKNGVEIFEGDIVIEKAYPFYGDAPEITSSRGKCEELNYVGVVTWDNESTGYFLDYRIVSDRVNGDACGDGIGEYRSLEVLGNIHQPIVSNTIRIF